MRRHRRFEYLAARYLQDNGFETEVTPGVADWGVDVFASNGEKRYVVQAKMYGDCKTKINRRMMMELYGVMHYFDCQGAMLIYNGKIMPDAVKVADKLGILLVYLDQHLMDNKMQEEVESTEDDFEKVWNEIRDLQGRKISNSRGTSYTIESVTDGDITYINEKGYRRRESADLFRRIIARIFSYGCIEQSQLRGEFGTYASAFISTVLANTQSCEVTPNPYTIWQAERLDLNGRFQVPDLLSEL